MVFYIAFGTIVNDGILLTGRVHIMLNSASSVINNRLFIKRQNAPKVRNEKSESFGELVWLNRIER